MVAGPSGSGKSTLLRRLFKDYPNSFGFSVSRELNEAIAICEESKFEIEHQIPNSSVQGD